MTWSKRLFDIASALFLGTVLAPLILYVAVLLYVREGRPILYRAERMKTPTQPFLLWKFCTMKPDSDDRGVSGGDKTNRITSTGAWLRDKRLDELPQLWNVLRGDISFVGPRPPLRRYTELFPKLYGQVLQSRPGLTGLATLVFHKTEERLLAQCETADQTERVYCARCVPRKAKLDLIYAKNRNLCGDFKLMCATVFRKISLH